MVKAIGGGKDLFLELLICFSPGLTEFTAFYPMSKFQVLFELWLLAFWDLRVFRP